ncbi:hypothetical protein [Azomonas macrocytogenes]|uniref:Transmembrane protein n=1 Tax=Azomonas macrocytogenes TaxID=69962 RepID=A0A839TBC8_AZOMA|nr:hypothetical protein [Azomonas macrocytogenes]MBB3104913.1 hypothetical protein [Azomonas macrocytogenes]
MPDSSPRLAYHALGAILACVVVNFLLRTFVKIGGPIASLLFATLIAIGMAFAFHWQAHRGPTPSERRGLVARYALGLGALYTALLVMMENQSTHGLVGLLVFFLHYACYPAMAWIALAPRWFKS